MSTKRVVIVGGGFAGLSAAYTLMKRGITPLLLEAKERVGGRGIGERVDGFSLDMGAFVFTSTYDTAFRMCEELGLPLAPSKMKFGHHRSGRWDNRPAAGKLAVQSPCARISWYYTESKTLVSCKERGTE